MNTPTPTISPTTNSNQSSTLAQFAISPYKNSADDKSYNFVNKLLHKYTNRTICSVNFNDLEGIIDFNVFSYNGYTNITSIYLEEGKITEIKNIPNNIINFVCKQNLLKSLPKVPNNLKLLNVEKNSITHIDLSQTPLLQTLNVSHNELDKIENIPSTISNLNVSFNKIQTLDLLGLKNLKILTCNDNIITRIKNIPLNGKLQEIAYFNNPLPKIQQLNKIPNLKIKTLVQRKQHNQPLTKETIIEPPVDEENTIEETIASNIDYNTAIQEYFKLKTQYERSVNAQIIKICNKYKSDKQTLKLMMQTFKGKCLNCKRPVGSIFTKKNNYYIAICGDVGKAPCNLNIKIFNGLYYNFFEDMHLFKENIKKSKKHIISLKMDVLFNFLTEQNGADVFKETYEVYKDNNSSFMLFFQKYQEIYNNPAKIELIHLKNTNINEIIEQINILLEEYKKNPLNVELIRNVVDLQYKQLLPEIQGLRNIKYEIMEMINTYEKGEVYDEAKESILIQKEHSFEKFIFVAEPGKVIRFDK